jgi:hypothetical protein
LRNLLTETDSGVSLLVEFLEAIFILGFTHQATTTSLSVWAGEKEKSEGKSSVKPPSRARNNCTFRDAV